MRDASAGCSHRKLDRNIAAFEVSEMDFGAGSLPESVKQTGHRLPGPVVPVPPPPGMSHAGHNRDGGAVEMASFSRGSLRPEDVARDDMVDLRLPSRQDAVPADSASDYPRAESSVFTASIPR